MRKRAGLSLISSGLNRIIDKRINDKEGVRWHEREQNLDQPQCWQEKERLIREQLRATEVGKVTEKEFTEQEWKADT